MEKLQALIEVIEEENVGILPDEARWKAEEALKYWHIIRKAEMKVYGD